MKTTYEVNYGLKHIGNRRAITTKKSMLKLKQLLERHGYWYVIHKLDNHNVEGECDVSLYASNVSLKDILS